METETVHDSVVITTGTTTLAGVLDIPPGASAIVILANGLGRMQHPIAEPFAARLREAGLATLIVDLLTADELQFDSRTSHFSSDAKFQSERILDVVGWIHENPSTRDLPIAGAAAGAAARGMLLVAGRRGVVKALVIEGNLRPNEVPAGIVAPTLLLVEDDPVELRRAETAMKKFSGPMKLRVVPSTEPALALDTFYSAAAGHLAAKWVTDSLPPISDV